MYVTTDFKSKKTLKAAVQAGAELGVFSPGPFPCPQDGRVAVEGPHYPAAHTWYAQVQVVDGVITKVIS